MQHGIYRTDATGRCVWVNSRLCELFELARDEVLDLGWTTRIHKDDLERVRQCRTSALGPRSTFEIDYRIQLPAQRTRWISAFSTPIMTNGEFAGRIGIVRDVTHLRRGPLASAFEANTSCSSDVRRRAANRDE